MKELLESIEKLKFEISDKPCKKSNAFVIISTYGFKTRLNNYYMINLTLLV